MTESLESYAKAFETMKKIRTLVWKCHVGFANIDLQIGDKKLNLTVSPVHAAIIYQFQEKAEWLASDLVSRLMFTSYFLDTFYSPRLCYI